MEAQSIKVDVEVRQIIPVEYICGITKHLSSLVDQKEMSIDLAEDIINNILRTAFAYRLSNGNWKPLPLNIKLEQSSNG